MQSDRIREDQQIPQYSLLYSEKSLDRIDVVQAIPLVCEKTAKELFSPRIWCVIYGAPDFFRLP